MRFEHDSMLSRRALLRNGLLTMLSLPLLAQTLSAEAQDAAQVNATPRRGGPYAPFRVGIQSYSLRHFKTEEMLAKTQELGLRNLEAYPQHFPMSDDPKVLAGYQDQLKAHNVRLVGYGVIDFSGNEADARKKFEFAKVMGVQVISAHPNPDAFAVLDKLTEEYKINIGIHNHGPGDDLYDTEEKLTKAVMGHSERIGSCNDTGHYLRSGVNPVQVAKEMGPRLHDIHLKNVKLGANNAKEFTEIGVTGGLLDTVALMRVLVDIKYRGPIMLEYEEHEDNPMPQIKECLDATQRFAKTIRDVGIPSDTKK